MTVLNINLKPKVILHLEGSCAHGRDLHSTKTASEGGCCASSQPLGSAGDKTFPYSMALHYNREKSHSSCRHPLTALTSTENERPTFIICIATERGAAQFKDSKTRPFGALQSKDQSIKTGMKGQESLSHVEQGRGGKSRSIQHPTPQIKPNHEMEE